MAVVVFDPATFKLAFPEFAQVPDARLTVLFGMVTATTIDNTDASIVVDPAQRAPMIDLLIAHMLTLFGYVRTDGTSVPGTGVVGRVSSATEGSVSTSLEYRAAATATEAWYNQTPYGAMYWAMTAPFRSFRYVALGHSGVGHSIDYRNRQRFGMIGNPGGSEPLGP